MNTVQLECFVSARCDAKFRQYANDPNFNVAGSKVGNVSADKLSDLCWGRWGSTAVRQVLQVLEVRAVCLVQGVSCSCQWNLWEFLFRRPPVLENHLTISCDVRFGLCIPKPQFLVAEGMLFHLGIPCNQGKRPNAGRIGKGVFLIWKREKRKKPASRSKTSG